MNVCFQARSSNYFHTKALEGEYRKPTNLDYILNYPELPKFAPCGTQTSRHLPFTLHCDSRPPLSYLPRQRMNGIYINPSYLLSVCCEPEGWSQQWVCARMNAELLNRTFLCVSMCLCAFVNNAIKCTLHVLYTIRPVLFSQVYRYIQSNSLAWSLL